MSLKDSFLKFFSKKRHITAVVVIIILLTIIGLNNYLPVGPGNYNQKQIDKIHSSTPSDHFSFAVMGDNKNSFKIFSKILKDIDNNHYTFAIDVGDLVYDGEKTKYRIFYNMIKNEQTPFLVAVGNHDIREGGAENYFDIFGKFYYSFDYDNSLFIVLDDANEDRIDAVQMKWLEEQLQRNYQHKFVFLHVPAFDPRPDTNHSPSNKQNAQEFINLMEKYKVDTVFASHIHAYFDETRNGINYVITGGAGSELWGTDADHYFNHYVKVEVDGDKISKEVIRFPSVDYNWFDRFFYNIWTYINGFWVAHKLLVILILIIFILLIDLFIGRVKNYLKEIADNLKKYIRVYQALYQDPRTPRLAKVFLWMAIGYFFLPFDLIPDFIPVVGHLDDAIIIPALIFIALKFIPKSLYQEHYQNVFKNKSE